MASSCVQPSPKKLPSFNAVLNQTDNSQRPLFFHDSAFCSVVRDTSSAPRAVISSLIIVLIFFNTRNPSGKYEYSPAPSLLINPARISSWAFFDTSSDGVCFRVLVKREDCLISRHGNTFNTRGQK